MTGVGGELLEGRCDKVEGGVAARIVVDWTTVGVAKGGRVGELEEAIVASTSLESLESLECL